MLACNSAVTHRVICRSHGIILAEVSVALAMLARLGVVCVKSPISDNELRKLLECFST